MHIDVHAYMRVFSVNMPRRQYLHIQACVGLIHVMMMLPAKTPVRHINSCWSILSCLITAVKLCVLFVPELQLELCGNLCVQCLKRTCV